MGELAFSKTRIVEREMKGTAMIVPALKEEGSLVLEMCNSSWVEDDRLFDLENPGMHT